MAVLDILEYPNPVLRQPCRSIEAAELLQPAMQTLITDMVDTMYACPGAVGLAAPQIGQPVQLLVMDATAKTDRSMLKVVINPVVLSQSKWKASREGCLSFPDYLITVKRARKVEAHWLDAAGQRVDETLLEYEAVIFQHELDHLQGVLFIDRMRNPQRDLIRRSELEASQTNV